MAEKQNYFDQNMIQMLEKLPEPTMRAEFEQDFMSKVLKNFAAEQVASYTRLEDQNQDANDRRSWGSSTTVRRVVGLSAAAIVIASISALALRTMDRSMNGDMALGPLGVHGMKNGHQDRVGQNHNGENSGAISSAVATGPQASGSSRGKESSTIRSTARTDLTAGSASAFLSQDASLTHSGAGNTVQSNQGSLDGSATSVGATRLPSTSQPGVNGLGGTNPPASNNQVSATPGTTGTQSNSAGNNDGKVAYADAVSNRQGMLSTDIQTSDAFFLARFGWHTAGLGMASLVQLPEARTPRDSSQYSDLLYFSVANLLSTDTGYDFKHYFGQTVEVDRIPLTEPSPFDKNLQADAIVLRSASNVIGAWIDLPQGKAVGLSLLGHSVDLLDHGNFALWLKQNVPPSIESESIVGTVDEPVDSIQSGQKLIEDYATAVNEGQMSEVRALLSNDFMLRRMINGRASLLNFNLGSATALEQGIHSITLLSVVPVSGAYEHDSYQLGLQPRLSQTFSVTADIVANDPLEEKPNQEVLWVTVVRNSANASWEIADIRTSFQS